MWPTGYVLAQRETSDSAATPTTPAMTTLRSVIAHLASTVRGAGIVYIVVQVLIWHSFYTADARRLAGPALAVAWAATVTVRLRRRWPALLGVCADSAVYAALALGAAGCVPPGVRDDAFSWLVIAMSGQLIVPAWYAPGALSLLLTLSSPLAYLAGAVLRPVTDARTLTGATMVLLLVGLLHTLGRRALYARAAVADAALDEANDAASEQYVVLSRTIERREHERLLHDTVLNTLTALARGGGDPAEAHGRCRRDVILIEAALGGPDHLAVGTTGPAGGGLLGAVRAVVADMRARGLTVHLEAGGPGWPGADRGDADRGGADRPGPDADRPGPDADAVAAVPAQVTLAIANAVREALSNVAAHAGTGEAWVTVRQRAREAAGQAPGRLEVTVRDQGSGFDPAVTDPGRLGLRRSITERAADCGGQASIWSAPGQGTVVRLSWPASASASASAPVPAPSGGRPPAGRAPAGTPR